MLHKWIYPIAMLTFAGEGEYADLEKTFKKQFVRLDTDTFSVSFKTKITFSASNMLLSDFSQ